MVSWNSFYTLGFTAAGVCDLDAIDQSADGTINTQRQW